jgi:signal transduction histidine kinase
MTDMVESLLALARTHQTPQREDLSLAELLSDVAETYQAEAAQHAMGLELESQVTTVKGDKTALKLVLQNLVQNAIKYGRTGGTIWLKSGLSPEAVFFEVSDDGQGIPEAELERLKQPFQRGVGLQGVNGSGLGLALASLVAEQHGGRLELGRAKQGGLSAIVYLPRY